MNNEEKNDEKDAPNQELLINDDTSQKKEVKKTTFEIFMELECKEFFIGV